MRILRLKHVNVLLIGAIVAIAVVGIVRRNSSREDQGATLPSRDSRTIANTSPDGLASSDKRRQSGRAATLDGLSRSFVETRPVIPTFPSDGTITQEALEFVGVQVSKRGAVQSVIDKLLAETESAMRRRIQEDRSKSDPSIGLKVYRVPAAEDEALEIIRQSAGELSDIIGSQEAMILMSKIQPLRHLSGMGMYDVTIRTIPESSDTPHPWTSGTITEPKSGRTVFTFSVVSENRQTYVGGLLEEFDTAASRTRQ